MKKFFVCGLILCLFGLGLNNYSFSAEQEQGYLAVNASSEMELTPDTVDFSVEIITTDRKSVV